MSDFQRPWPSELEGEIVEIFGVQGEVEVLESTSGQEGTESVNPNGKQAQVVACDEDSEQCVVHTFDGLFLRVSAQCLRLRPPARPEEGGFDVVWPAGPAVYPRFAQRLAETLWAKGYCVVRTFNDDQTRQAAAQAALAREDFALPRAEFEEELLGSSASSKIAPIAEVAEEDASWDALKPYVQFLRSFCWVTSLDVSETFNYIPWQALAGAVLRVPLTRPAEREDLQPGPLGEAEAQAGEAERHLDLLRRRRLCLLYMVHNRGGGFVELTPRAVAGSREDGRSWPAARLPIQQDTVLVFCHDRLSYSYTPKSPQDVVLQAWMLEEPQALQFESFEGSQKAFEGIVGGPEQSVDRQVHVMSCFTRFPGRGLFADAAWCVFSSGNSTMLEIPTARWDINVYWTEDAANNTSRSVSKHSGLLDMEEWQCFDNDFFGVSREEAALMAPCHRILLETGFQTLHLAGSALAASLKGSPVGTFVADSTADWDPWLGYSDTWFRQADQENWLTGNCGQVVGAVRLMYTLGLTGTVKSVDTACSSALTAGNLCHSELLFGGPQGRVTTGLVLSSQNIFNPMGWVGLSVAGMVGPAGIVMWGDQRANGMTRGEGAGGLCLRVSRSVQATMDRIAVYTGSYINQDGRSASLTAPNGPSQQKCIHGGLRQGSLSPADLSYMETHGTGTALGDPIEVGSTRAVFSKRSMPLMITTAKSHLAHLEGAAGMANLVKVLMSLNHMSVAPNCHLRAINSHIEIEGFPSHLTTEVVDIGADRALAGTNSFGFGGTNAHADLWSRCRHGPRKLTARRMKIDRLDYIMVACSKCSGRMCFLCGVAVPKRVREGKHHCAAVRADPLSYEYCSNCYSGGYVCGEETVYREKEEEEGEEG